MAISAHQRQLQLKTNSTVQETSQSIQDASELPIQSRLLNAWMSIAPYARPAMTVIVFCAALWLLHHEFSTITLKDVAASFRSLSTFAIMAAIALTMANYIVLIGYDWLGVRLIGHSVGNKQIVTASLY